MPKLSVIIPSRDEQFLVPTIDDIFRHARGEIEVVAVIDSDKWPANWKEVAERHPNLHTIHNGKSIGMRGSINAGVASAISRGAKFIMKSDGHCSFSEGFDEILKKDCEPDWVVVPRRGRLDPEAWTATETHKPDIDYHYLSFPDDPNDFGGPGLNGKVWSQRAIERKDILLDEEMSSQGSCWFMHANYFSQLELMDEAHWGTFWCEFQEIGLRCWLSGGRVMINKQAKYLHLHKGKKYGRGYRLNESELQKGRERAMLWPWNEEWSKQTKPFKWLIEHFWPVPTWPENWEEILYAERKPRAIVQGVGSMANSSSVDSDNNLSSVGRLATNPSSLKIHEALYGPSGTLAHASLDVTERLRSLIRNGSLDIVVSNSTLCPGQNPHRGKKKSLTVTYSFDGGEPVTIEREEKDWLIIGPVRTNPEVQDRRMAEQQTAELSRMDGVKKLCPYCSRLLPLNNRRFPAHVDNPERELREVNPVICKGSGKEYIQNPAYTSIDTKSGAYVPAEITPINEPPRTAAALTDYLIRKFQISPQRLRGPMPIELRDFHRNDLARLFAELGFKRGAEIGVAEGNYSEVLLKANPECELLLVDPWHAYSDNPQNKSKEKHEFAFNETLRKTASYNGVDIRDGYSMDMVRTVKEESLDFCYIDGHHSFDYVMQDLIEWSKRVRSGGLVCGDDYIKLDEKRWGAGPIEAVQAYTNAHRIPIWYIFQGHKSVDFMWCKP